MPYIWEEDVVEYNYSTDSCDTQTECVTIDKPQSFNEFDPIYPPYFVDDSILPHIPVSCKMVKNATKEAHQVFVYLEHHLPTGTVFKTETSCRDFVLAEFISVDRDKAYKYLIKSLEEISPNELDLFSLKKGHTLIYKGKAKQNGEL